MDEEDRALFRAHVALWEWLEKLAQQMRDEASDLEGQALLLLQASQRLDPGR